MKDFQKQELSFFNHRLDIALWLGTIVTPLFAVLDFVVVHSWFGRFLLYRLGCAALLAFLLLLHRCGFGRRKPFLMALFAALVVTSVITAMVIHLGGINSFYYVGVIMVMITCTAILPLTARQTAYMGALLYLAYAIPIIFIGVGVANNLPMLFNNSFFFVFFVVIAVIQNQQDYEARLREYDLRNDLDLKADELNDYATNLEGVVETRVQELAESELRYQELYDNIVDMVVLIDNTGTILACNRSFSKIVAKAHQKSILDIIHTDDREYVADHIVNQGCKNLHGVQFQMIDDEHKVIEVECNARSLLRENQFMGFQLVARDVTTRNQLERDLVRSLRETEEARKATILGLAKLTEYRDSDTGGHLERIREYARILARELATKQRYVGYITTKYIDDVYQSSVLHDIGKVGIPDAILLKPGKLSTEEFSLIKLHSVYGGDMLKAIEKQVSEPTTFLTLGKIIAYHHHERWDGRGYPDELKGEDIPLSTRLVALADVYDALTSQRSYKQAISHEEATALITAERGTHFDPDVVDAFMANASRFGEIRAKLIQ